MRLFVGIPLAPPAREVLGRVLVRLEGMGWPVRWHRADDLHLTLKFLGEVGGERVDQVSGALAEALEGTPELHLVISGLGVFPHPARARVIWAGVENEPALELLADRLERRLEPLGFPVEWRPFHPHVTLGRVREGRRLPAEAGQELERPVPSASFEVPNVVLYESITGPSGAQHNARVTVPLGQRS